jgi:hypothetical protein
MDELLDDYNTGRIQLRDKWQFELKSDLFPLSTSRNNIIQQEFYFFIPNSLQINDATYSKAQFYRDQTNLIRFKTPAFTLEELIKPEYPESPLIRLKLLLNDPLCHEKIGVILEEIKLLGNVFHSALRNQIVFFMNTLNKPLDHHEFAPLSKAILEVCQQIDQFCLLLKDLKPSGLENIQAEEVKISLNYIQEFVSLKIHDYFTALLYRLRLFSNPVFNALDERLSNILLREQQFRQEKFGETIPTASETEQNEYILYRKGLLNKFVIDPLLLKINREATSQRYRNIIGAIPAGVAMLVYLMVLFLWQSPSGQGNFLLVNSQALILLTVIVYILKDRIKEELKFLSFQKAAQWFSDYRTEIFSLEDTVLGSIKETFYFIEENKLTSEVLEIRNRQFHNILEDIKRPEKVIYYKKVVNINKKPKTLETRFYGLNIIFRFDIHHFLTKCENSYHTYLNLNPETLKLTKIQLPRVYHINIILKNTKALPDGGLDIELNKYRLVVDKNGIKRIEQV